MNFESWQRRTKLLLEVNERRARAEELKLSPEDQYDFALAWGYWRGVASVLKRGVIVRRPRSDAILTVRELGMADAAVDADTLAGLWVALHEHETEPWPSDEMADTLIRHLAKASSETPEPERVEADRSENRGDEDSDLRDRILIGLETITSSTSDLPEPENH